MKITCIQMDVGDKPKERNIARALKLVDQADESDLILLPEIWSIGYFSFARYAADSEPLSGATVEAFKEKARQRQCHILMGSFVEKQNNKLHNTTLLINAQGQISACYRKIHLFGYRSAESKLLTAGKDVVVTETPWGLSGFSTCYDLRFPELYRSMLNQGATFFLIPSAWPLVRVEAWRLFNRARAHENLAYLISCNAAGMNAGKRLAGHSMIVDPMGRIVAEAGEKEELLFAQIDPGMVDTVREEFRFLDDRVL